MVCLISPRAVWTPAWLQKAAPARLSVLRRSFIICGGIEDVVGVLTHVCRGVAQVFHVLHVEVRLLLVVEVEDGEKEDGQEEGEEVKGGSQVEEKTTTWMTMVME